MLGSLLSSFGDVLSPMPLLFCLIGTVVGISVGAIPGLSGAMVIALTLPLTFYMDELNALILLIAMYVGSTAGGLISATLMRMPGTTAALMTVLDGFPMAQSGRPGRALGIGITASFFGGIVSWLFLASLSPFLAELAVRFGPFEIFSMVVVALMLVASISPGSLTKGLISAVFGTLVALAGIDEATGAIRLNFGFENLEGGFTLLPVIMGMMIISQVMADVLDIGRPVERLESSMRGMFLSLKDLVGHLPNLIRSSLIGTWIGILPGIGGTTAAIASYTTARNVSSEPEKFGTGSESGIVAAEAANNAGVNGALVPLITLGIPGSLVDAILLGAFVIHNLVPGPLLFQNNPEIAYGVIAAALVANVLMFVLMLGATPIFARLMGVSKAWLLPPIIVFCVIGAFAESNRLFDVWVMFGFGLVGFAMQRMRVPLGPFVIGYVLAPIAEVELRRGLVLYDGSYLPLISRPVSLAFLIIAAVSLAYPFLRSHMRRRRAEAN